MNEKPDEKPLVANTLADIMAWGQAGILFFGTTDVWFRGHAKADWKLVPNVHRQHDYKWERNTSLRFRRRAKTRHDKYPPDHDPAGWLFLAQHYTLPTRLLDWTESVLVATYFAVLEHDDEPAVVWFMKPGLLNQHQNGVDQVFEVGHPTSRPIVPQTF